MKSGIGLLVGVILILVVPFNRPQMVGISLQGILGLSGMVVQMSG